MHNSETPQILIQDGSNMTHNDPGLLTMAQEDIPGIRGAPGGSEGHQGASGGARLLPTPKNSDKTVK